MKYKGKKVEGKNVEIIPISRPDGDIIFIAEAVSNWDEFERLAPEPKPPTVTQPGGKSFQDISDKTYIKNVELHNTSRTNWIILKSLQATKELEWETIDLSKPETWSNFEKELKDSDFTPVEIGRIVRGVMLANSLDDDMVDAAKADFLAMREEKGK